MEKEFAGKDWDQHPFLKRLTVRSDFDGDSAFCLGSDASPEDIEFANKVKIFSRLNGGEWKLAPFTPEQAFVWFTSPAWHYALGAMFHPGFLLESGEREKWNWEFKAIVES